MALTNAEASFINRNAQAAKTLLDLYGELIQLDQLYAGAADFDASITQGDLDSVATYTQSGLTTTVIADAQFGMSAIRTSITNMLAALSVLANVQR